MKKALALTLALLLTFVMLAPVAAQDDTDTYFWEEAGISFEYPSDPSAQITTEGDNLSIILAVPTDDYIGLVIAAVRLGNDVVAADGVSGEPTTYEWNEQALIFAAPELGADPQDEIIGVETELGILPVLVSFIEGEVLTYSTIFSDDEQSVLFAIGFVGGTDVEALEPQFLAIVDSIDLDGEAGSEGGLGDADLGDSGSGDFDGDRALEYGETVNENLTGAELAIDFTFEGEAGDIITIDMQAFDIDNLDTYLYLYDEDGNEIALDDDGGEATNSRLSYTILADGTYTIEANSFGQGDTGAFSLTLSLVGESEEVSYGDVVDAEFTDEQLATAYTFEASAGDTVTIAFTAADTEDVDGYLELYNEDGEMVTENDDFNSSLNPTIIYDITEDGTYTILATSYGGFDTGPFTIEITSDNADTGSSDASETDSSSAAPPAADGLRVIDSFENTIEIGESVRGVFTDELPEHIMSFEGEPGQGIVVVMVADEDTDVNQYFVQVQGAEDFVEAVDAANNTYTVTATLDDGGQYAVYVLSTAFEADGYTLTLAGE